MTRRSAPRLLEPSRQGRQRHPLDALAPGLPCIAQLTERVRRLGRRFGFVASMEERQGTRTRWVFTQDGSEFPISQTEARPERRSPRGYIETKAASARLS